MNIIDQIVHNIIRPTRDRYHINRLGQRSFTLPLDNQPSVSVIRYDQQIMNKNKQKIELSYFANSTANSDSCVIYLHANNGSRV